MAGFFQNIAGFLRRRTDDAPLPRPAVPVCIIGDPHGRHDLLTQMLALVDAQPGAATARIIVVGDMVDRGPATAAVLRTCFERQRAAPEQFICLMGNHERMMLDFLIDPPQHGARWIAAGGAETLTSFGLSPWQMGPDKSTDHLTHLAQALRTAFPAGMVAWLEALPLIWREDNLIVTHAGADPTRLFEHQDPTSLIWGHRAFLRQPRKDGIWVGHGHTIVENAQAQQGRIAVDTGAWRSGRLSAAWLDQSGLSILKAT